LGASTIGARYCGMGLQPPVAMSRSTVRLTGYSSRYVLKNATTRLRSLKRLDQAIERHTIEARMRETDAILMMLVEAFTARLQVFNNPEG